MTAVPFVLLGAVVGVVLVLGWLHRWSLSDEGQRIVARMEAERRIEDVETRALRAVAAAAEGALQRTSQGGQWPSSNGADIDGTAVEITTKEG